MEEVWGELKTGLLEVADTVCGNTKCRPKHKETCWWNEDVAAAVKEKRKLFKICQKSKCESSRELYCQAIRVAKAVVAKAQETSIKNFGEMLDKAENRGQVFRVAKQMVLRNKDVLGGGYVEDRKGQGN